MRVILIDPARQSMKEADLPVDLDNLQEAVGGLIEYAHMFDNGDSLIVNEEGFLEYMDAMRGREPAEKAFMFDIGAHQPFAGKGIIVGPENNGIHTDAISSINEIGSRLTFIVPGAFGAHDGNKH